MVIFGHLRKPGHISDAELKNICEFVPNIISRMKRRKRSGTQRELWGVSERQTH